MQSQLQNDLQLKTKDKKVLEQNSTMESLKKKITDLEVKCKAL